MKILLSAFSCCPGGGSEPGIGWNWVQQISRRHEVWLISSDEYQSRIEKELPPNVNATFVPSFRLWSRLQEARLPGLDWLYYYWWQWKVYRVARRLHAKHNFDIAHHVTFGSWRAPSFLALLPIPFIWGPVGGGETIPVGLRSELSRWGRLFETSRSWANHLSRLDPALRLTMAKAARILVVNRETACLIPAKYQNKTHSMPAIGISACEKIEAIPSEQKPAGFTILFVCLLESRKGGTLAIKAVAQMLSGGRKATLVVLGRGVEQPRLVELAAELGIAEQVQFLGGKPRPQVLGWMQLADVFLFPSLRDSGGVVLLEAMMAGKPVICLDGGGPAEIVNEKCGIKVKTSNPKQVIGELASGLEKLFGNPQLRHQMGEAGRERVRTYFNWDKKGDQLMEMYKQLYDASISQKRSELQV